MGPRVMGFSNSNALIGTPTCVASQANIAVQGYQCVSKRGASVCSKRFHCLSWPRSGSATEPNRRFCCPSLRQAILVIQEAAELS